MPNFDKRPWLPVEYTDRDIGAIQALARGEADAATQQHALRFIVENISECYDMAWVPESDRASCFAAGKRHVGLQIVKLTKLNIGALRKIDG